MGGRPQGAIPDFWPDRRPPGGQGAVAHDPRQAVPGHILHGKKVLPFPKSDLVNSHDIRMLQTGRGRGLSAKPLYSLRARQLPEQQHFESDEPVQAHLSGLIHHAHATPRDFFNQFVVTELAEE